MATIAQKIGINILGYTVIKFLHNKWNSIELFEDGLWLIKYKYTLKALEQALRKLQKEV